MNPPDQPLRHDDFPLRANGSRLLRRDGSELAQLASAELAKDLADRLNRDEGKRQEENWSA